MTFSGLSEKNDAAELLLRKRLETFGRCEILLWKEMVLRDEPLFAQIYRLIYCDNPRISWHAAWVIDHVSEADPCRLEPYVTELIDQLPKLKSSALKRHFTRMINRHTIPEERLGKLIDVLYNLLSPVEATAVRANAIEILLKIALSEPALRDELILVTEAMLEEKNTPGMISKGKKVLRSLKNQ
jgi:hypothetical protein